MPCCAISNCAQMSKTIIAVRHFRLGGREPLETAVKHQILIKHFNYCILIISIFLHLTI